MFCLPKELVDKFIEKLKNGEIAPERLSDMTSAERHSYFSKFLGEQNAAQVNALFESKLLLKNQQLGIINWAKKVTGMSPEVQRDILSRVNRMTKVLEPTEMDAFLSDLAAQKLGMSVTLAEANKIAELAKRTQQTKESMQAGGDRLEYGKARVDFHNYINELKLNSQKMSFGEQIREPGKLVSNLAGTAKGLKASFDLSALLRQGLKTLITNPTIWYKNAIQSFIDVAHSLGGKNVMNEVNADIVSRQNSVNGLYKKAKLDVGTVEEAFPTALAEKIPGIGKLYKTSQDAFVAFMHRVRADVFDKYIEIAEKSGVDLTDKIQLESIGKLVNSLTGRGRLGSLEPVAGTINNLFFSARLLKSNLDTLTAHYGVFGLGADKLSPFARKIAATNLLKIIMAQAAIMTIANAISPGSAEKDPRSANFGKIKAGNTRFDISGGMSSLVTLAARLAPILVGQQAKTKSSITGIVRPIGTGEFGSQSGMDVLVNFFENKLSPIAGVVRDLLKQETFQGTKPTLGNELANLLVPLPVTNFQEVYNDPNGAPVIIAMIADALGVGTNTYSGAVDWTIKPGVELQQFQSKVGPEKFKEANDLFNQKYADWFKVVITKPAYQGLSEEDKQKVITKKRGDIKEEVFKKYNFTPKKSKPTKLPKL